MQSPLLALPGAVAGDGIDAPVAAHYGSFNTEQRSLARGDGFVDLSHRDVVRISGPERLSWLHNLTTQYFDGLAPGTWTQALVLSPQGHVEHAFTGVDDGEAFTAHTEPGAGAALAEWLERMKFMTRVEVSLVDDLAVMWRPGRGSAATTSCPATASRRTPTLLGRPAGSGRSRPCASSAASPGWASTPTIGRSPTKPAGSARPSAPPAGAAAPRRVGEPAAARRLPGVVRRS